MQGSSVQSLCKTPGQVMPRQQGMTGTNLSRGWAAEMDRATDRSPGQAVGEANSGWGLHQGLPAETQVAGAPSVPAELAVQGCVRACTAPPCLSSATHPPLRLCSSIDGGGKRGEAHSAGCCRRCLLRLLAECDRFAVHKASSQNACSHNGAKGCAQMCRCKTWGMSMRSGRPED